MEVLLGKKAKEILANLQSRKQLASAIAQSTESRARSPRRIILNGKAYVLRPRPQTGR